MSPQNDFQNYRPITGCERSFFVFNGDFNGEMAKNHFLAINLVGVCYNHLVITAELHFYSSFQGYPTCHYWSPMARWPDGHKWPFWPYLAIYGHLAIEPCATNRAQRCVPVPPVWMKGKKLVSKPWLWRSSISMYEIKSANNLCSFFLFLVNIYLR